MNDSDAAKSDYAVELLQHAVQIVDDIIARIMDVAGVETDSQAAVILDLVNNRRDLLEAAANLGALARHRLQRDVHVRLLRVPQHFIQALRNAVNSIFGILVRIGARMKHDIIYADAIRAVNLILQE